MLTIAKLFGKSPFSPIQSHMKKVGSCIKKLTDIFAALTKGDFGKIEQLAKELSKLEHEADLTKNDIRNHLPKSIFLPVDRHQLLEILSIQDNLADKAEDIGNLLCLSPLNLSDEIYKEILMLYEKNCEAFWETRMILKEMGDLLESSFGGMEAERVKSMTEKVSYKEYEADKMKHTLLKRLFSISSTLTPATFYLSVRVIEEINALSNISEKLANRIRMILELK